MGITLKPYLAALAATPPPQPGRPADGAVARMSANENPLGPSPLALAAAQQALLEMHRYPDGTAAELRDALARRVGLQADQVVLTNGSDELIWLLCDTFLREGDEVLTAAGTFTSYARRALAQGATLVQVPLVEYRHDLPAMAAAISPRTRLIFVCIPNNPTGTSNRAVDLLAFLECVPDDVLVVIDEAYYEFVTDPDYPQLTPLLQAGRTNLLLLRTFAKIYGLAGIRVGYGYAHADIVAALDRSRPFFNVNIAAQAAALAALEDNDHVERSREHAAASRELFSRELSQLGVRVLPGETNFIAVEVGDDLQLAARLRERGFQTNPLSGWGLPGLLRISFGTTEENLALIATLRDLLP
jgi:histidinol-phosphate aminotransferase